MNSPKPDLLILPGDGIGPEVVGQARRILEWFAQHSGPGLNLVDAAFGASAWRSHGAIIPDQTLEAAKRADAILFGAQGGPEEGIPREALVGGSGLLHLRRDLDVYANLRPVVIREALRGTSPLRPERSADVDFLFVRELTGGLYFGEPRGIEDLGGGRRRGTDTQTYTTDEVARVARVAFELARGRVGQLVSVDKSNVLESGKVWRREVQRVGDEEYPDVGLGHLHVDNCAMQLVIDPSRFDVILTDNMFGDILSDLGGGLVGSLGMIPSASLGAVREDGSRPALYEPIHGSAPDIAGKDIANPIAAILCVAMAFRYSFGREADALLIETAVDHALAAGMRTRDIAGSGEDAVGCVAMGDAVLAGLDRAL